MYMPSPGLTEFDYAKTASLAEASRLLAEHAGEARPLQQGSLGRTFVGLWLSKLI